MNQRISRLLGKTGASGHTKRVMKRIYKGLNWIEKTKFVKNLKEVLRRKNESSI